MYAIKPGIRIEGTGLALGVDNGVKRTLSGGLFEVLFNWVNK
jgi:hypothetical protein